jgi:transcriptional regulator with XRE-family HTH domain
MPGRVFARRVYEARKRRGWHQKDLAARLVEIGYVDESGRPILSRATLSKIEKNDRSVSLEDVLAIAAALDASPVHLIVPREDVEPHDPEIPVVLQVTRGLPPVPTMMARSWLRGRFALRVALGIADARDADTIAAFLAQVPTSEIVRGGQALGLDEDQIADALSGIRTGVIPYLSGQPWPDQATRIRKELADLEQLRTDTDTRIAELRKEQDDA